MSLINNEVRLTGNVGKDPEVTYNPNGSVVATFSMATNDSYKDKAGVWKERTTWHNLTCWGDIAKRVERFVQKGTNVSIVGKLAVDSWDDKEGKKHYKTYVQIEEFRTNTGGKTRQDDNDFNRM